MKTFAPRERCQLLLPAAALQPFVIDLTFDITYYLPLRRGDKQIRERRVQNYGGTLKIRPVRTEETGAEMDNDTKS